MEVLIRETAEAEFFRTENLTREAFWNIYKPGCEEHLVLNQIRKSKCYIKELDLVAVFENEIIGHIISSKARVLDPGNEEHEVLCVGPVSVLPKFQGKGIGIQLMNKSVAVAGTLHFPGMILFGNPDYYHRFGFKDAREYSITTKDGQNFEPFMALELNENGLVNTKGRFFEDQAFETQPETLAEFEKKFHYKEKLVTDTQFKH